MNPPTNTIAFNRYNHISLKYSCIHTEKDVKFLYLL